MGMKASFARGLASGKSVGAGADLSRFMNKKVAIGAGLAGVGALGMAHAGTKKRQHRLGMRSVGRVSQVSSGGTGQYVARSIGGSTGF